MTQPTSAKRNHVTSPTHGEMLVANWRQSGLSQAAYARQQQIPLHRLSYWIRKRDRSVSTTTRSTTERQIAPEPFIQIPWQTSQRGRGAIEMHLESGVLIRAYAGADPELLRTVIQSLSRTGC